MDRAARAAPRGRGRRARSAPSCRRDPSCLPARGGAGRTRRSARARPRRRGRSAGSRSAMRSASARRISAASSGSSSSKPASRWRRATARCAGTRMPRNRSPSPYSPGPVLKKRCEWAARSGSASAASSSAIAPIARRLAEHPQEQLAEPEAQLAKRPEHSVDAGAKRRRRALGRRQFARRGRVRAAEPFAHQLRVGRAQCPFSRSSAAIRASGLGSELIGRRRPSHRGSRRRCASIAWSHPLLARRGNGRASSNRHATR